MLAGWLVWVWRRWSRPQVFIVYGLPEWTVAATERQQNVLVWVCAALQLLSMVAMNLLAYLPYHSLLKVGR